MLHIHFSNRLELLRAALLRHLHEAAPADVFAAEQVIVPSAAMRRHLSLAIADARGICANLRFGFLAQWLWQQIARVVGGVGEDSPYAAARLTWRVHAAFGDAAFVSRHARLAAYLRDADALMRHELARQVAALLEQYVTYRPDWLQAWGDQRLVAATGGAAAQAPDDEAWQAALWRRIDAELGLDATQPAQGFAAALQRGGREFARLVGLPPCVHVFALPSMAPLHMRLLRQLGSVVEVHLYVLNPCQEYWFDLIDRRRLGYLRARGRASGLEEEGNRLLASWGVQTQMHVDSLVEACGEDAEDDADFAPARGDSLLALLQDAMLELRAIEPGSIKQAEGDRSVELHVCHSLTRELEVLQDHLLGLFAADSQLRPGDVLVVTPDLDAATPLIDAIFGTAPPQRALPYALCGSARSSANLPARALLGLLALAGSRGTASEVFALLQQPPVARRFAFDDEALAQAHEWLREAGFHWALDAQQRARFDVPATPRHALDDALQRLFLGYALPSNCAEPFAARLGAGDAEGSRAPALGALWRYATALQRAGELLRRPKPPQAWAAALSSVLDDFIAPLGDELDDLRELRQSIRQLADDMQLGGAGEALALEVVRAALQQRLDDTGSGGAAGGSVNFASMSSLRGLPFRVVCAIGLNDGAFPAPRRPLEFDLMALHPRRGDRQPRGDERGLMLDLLLAARDSLYLSHTGRSVRDNAPLPPSVLVAELLDLLVPAIASDPDAPASLQQARSQLVIEHPLQAFALAAFDIGGDERLRSFDRELADALRGSLAAPGPAPHAPAHWDEQDDAADDDDASAGEPRLPFFRAPLPVPGPEWRQVSLAQLLEFFRNPSRALLRRRLGIALARDSDELENDEPFVSDTRTRAALARRLLPLLLQGTPAQALPALARAGTELPDGAIGEAQLLRELQALEGFAGKLLATSAEPALPPHAHTLDLALDGEPWQLHWAFADLRPTGLLRWRYAPTRAADRIAAWLQHLALCAAPPPGVAPHTRWLSSDGEFSLAPCAEAGAALRALLALYRQGLSEPLPFYPRSAWQYHDKGAGAARAAWLSVKGVFVGESEDPAYQLALRGVDDPLDQRFEALAQGVFGPLAAHLQDDRR